MTLQRIISILPATDCHDRCTYNDPRCTPGGNYHGIRDAVFAMSVVGDAGAVEFWFHSGWYLRATSDRIHRESHDLFRIIAPDGTGRVDLHRWAPIDGDTLDGGNYHSECAFHDGKACWSVDGGYLAGQQMYDLLTSNGADPVWAALEQRYTEAFTTEG